MSNIVRRVAGTPLSEQALNELQSLASRAEAEIDLVSLPERRFSAETEQLHAHTVTLFLEDDVASWLTDTTREQPEALNGLLKREAEQRKHSRRASATPLDRAS